MFIGKVCPFCKTEITEQDTVKVCPACGIPHHEDCWVENQGCTTFGCLEKYEPPVQQQEQPANASDDFSTPAICPQCGATIGAGRSNCMRCGSKRPTEVICPNCGGVIRPDQAFCAKCGTARPFVPAVAKPQKKICKSCGNELQDGQDFCPVCGQKTDLSVAGNVSSAIDQYNQNMQSSRKKSPIVPIVIAVAALAIVLFFVIRGTLVDEITLTQSNITLTVDKSYTLFYTIEPSYRENINVKWSSSNTSVATVSPNGVVRAINEGTCTITVKAAGKKDTVRVEVVELSPEEEKFVGTWKTIGMIDDYFTSLYSSFGSLVIYDDFTGKLVIDDTTSYFTWEYSNYDDGDYFYDIYFTESDTRAMITYYRYDTSVILLIGEYLVVFQK